ncbi:hypothetical protein [Streptomyces sp. NPDC059466]|uniref:hypothetical protein n=1 Tax=unclassified Streptomyces TaxID=2593676 RepID=UPI0036B460FD
MARASQIMAPASCFTGQVHHRLDAISGEHQKRGFEDAAGGVGGDVYLSRKVSISTASTAMSRARGTWPRTRRRSREESF